MSYNSLIDKGLMQAFNMSKDLAIPVSISKSNDTGFDFGTGLPIDAPTSIATKAVEIDVKQSSEGKTTVVKQLLLKTKEVGVLKTTDTILSEGDTYIIGAVVKAGRFMTLIEIYREL
jgi:hypothetical protein